MCYNLTPREIVKLGNKLINDNKESLQEQSIAWHYQSEEKVENALSDKMLDYKEQCPNLFYISPESFDYYEGNEENFAEIERELTTLIELDKPSGSVVSNWYFNTNHFGTKRENLTYLLTNILKE